MYVKKYKGVLLRMSYLAWWKSHIMHDKRFDYYSKFEAMPLPDQKQLITYSFNEKESTITGLMLEKKGLIFLYEYRGEYIGVEFFISFSKESISYKLIKVEEMPVWIDVCLWSWIICFCSCSRNSSSIAEVLFSILFFALFKISLLPPN